LCRNGFDRAFRLTWQKTAREADLGSEVEVYTAKLDQARGLFSILDNYLIEITICI
jgi:hypothetical protein